MSRMHACDCCNFSLAMQQDTLGYALENCAIRVESRCRSIFLSQQLMVAEVLETVLNGITKQSSSESVFKN